VLFVCRYVHFFFFLLLSCVRKGRSDQIRQLLLMIEEAALLLCFVDQGGFCFIFTKYSQWLLHSPPFPPCSTTHTHSWVLVDGYVFFSKMGGFFLWE
jgi:hypothetical protein